MPRGGKRTGAGRKKGSKKGSLSKTETITVRVRPELRAALEASARKKDIPVSQEIKQRLTESFSAGLRDEQIRFFGGDETFALMALIGQAAKHAGQISTHGLREWYDNEYSFKVALLAAENILRRFAPSDAAHEEVLAGSIATHLTAEQLAQSIANGTVHTVLQALPERPVNGAANAEGGRVYYSDQLLMGPEIRRRLGTLFDRLNKKVGTQS